MDTSDDRFDLRSASLTVDAQGNQIIYFNDDNTNAVMQLGPVASTGGGPGPY
jgi:hypothetical protein